MIRVDFGVGEGPVECRVRVLSGPFLKEYADMEVVFFSAILIGKIESFDRTAVEKAGDNSADRKPAIVFRRFIKQSNRVIGIVETDGGDDSGDLVSVFWVD